MRRRKELVGDCTGGEIVRVAAGLVRITGRFDGERWARLLRDDQSETDHHLWLDPRTPVLELVAEPSSRPMPDIETDPLLARLR